MRSLRLRILRLPVVVAVLVLGLALPGAATADGPPYSDGGIPDAIASCAGSPYDMVERDGDLYVRCYGTVGDDWRVFTTSSTVDATAATITITREHARGRALVGYQTQPGTAVPTIDYLATSGRVYFDDEQTTATVTVPRPTLAPPPGTPARSFTVVFDDPVALGLTVPTATVELPAAAVSPDPGYPDGPPYAPSTVPIDAEYFCDGGFYSLPTHNGDRYLWCLGSNGNKPWQQLSPQAVVGEDTATITISRPDGRVPIVVGFATEAETALAGRDFTAARGELYFAVGVTSRTLTIPIVRDPDAGEPRSFSLRLTEPVRQGLGTLPEIGVTIPGNPPTESAPPTVVGTARVGHELTSTDGEWTHDPTGVVRSWERCDATGSGCVAVDGADGATYEPSAADVGSRLRVAVTVTNGSGSLSGWSAPSAVVRAAIDAPTFTGGPTGSQILHRATFAFTGETGATFECRLGDDVFAPCVSGLMLIDLPAGEHRFEVRQTATDGVVSDPAVREWTVLPSPDPEYPLAPPYGHRVDADEECDGGAFQVRTHNADRYAACLAGPGTQAWQRFTATVDVEGTTATVTVTRDAGSAATLLSFETVSGTATGGVHYERREGELYFAPGVTSRTVEVPVTRDPDATSDRAFTVQLRDFLGLGLRVDDATVTIPGKQPDPDPGEEPGPGGPPTGGEPGPGGPPTPPHAGEPGPGAPAPGHEPPPGPPISPGVPPFTPPTPPAPPAPAPQRAPVRMTTIRLTLRFCSGCTTIDVRDRKRLQRLRDRVDGSRLLAIDGYGDRGKSRSANRKLARSRARAVERLLMSGVRRKPARRSVVGHARAIAPVDAEAGRRTRSAARDRVVAVRVVNRR